MEDLERAALFEAVCSWFRRQYGYERLPLGPDQVYFYDRVVDEVMEDEDAGIELDPQIWGPPSPWLTFGLSLAVGVLLAFVFLFYVQLWGWGAFLWVALGGGGLLVYPVMLMHRNRTAVEISEGEQADLETVRQVALACLDSNLLRWILHRFVNGLLFFFGMSYTRGAARLVIEEYAAGVGVETDRDSLPARERRGAQLAERLAEMLGEGGLALLLKLS